MSDGHERNQPTTAPIDPVEMARRDLRKALPRRFYRDVGVGEGEGGFGPLLDGRPVRTPGKAPLTVPTRALAEAIAAEWAAQAEIVDPETMPLTKLANSAIDGVARTMEATADDVARFGGSDLVCYRAGDPDALVAAQSAAWDPVLDFAHKSLGARLVCTQGMLYVEQPETAREAVRAAVAAVAEGGALRLAALSVMTSLTGSVLLALAVARGATSAEAAWDAAHVDEDYQMRFWGADTEALARRARSWRDMAAAAMVFSEG